MSWALDAARAKVRELLSLAQGAEETAAEARAAAIAAEKTATRKRREYEEARAELARMEPGGTS